MAATVFIETVIAHPPKRTRKTHNKVRSGCLTCKIRRKKCDEEKPFCKRCTSTGRRCDGYEKNQPEQKTTKPSPDSATDVPSQEGTKSPSPSPPTSPEEPNKSLQLWRPPKSEWFATDHDYYSFDFFRNRTGPEFACYFDSSIWRSFIIRACFLYPTVLQAAAAVGAVHRRFELGISPEAFRFCDIASKQYRKAVRCLELDLKSGHPKGPEINMVVQMLLAIFETFQGNYNNAVTHLSTAIKRLIKRKNMRRTHTESQYKCVNVGYKSLHDLADRLERQAPRLFGSQATILTKPELDTELDPVPRVFRDLEEARDVLFTEAVWIWDAWLQLQLGNIAAFSTQHLHISRLLEWSMAYAEHSKTDRCSNSPQDRQAAHLLKSYRETLYLVLLTQMAFHEPDGTVIVPLCNPPETCDCHTSCINYAERKSALNAHLARLLVLTESLFDDASSWGYREHSVSVDSGIGPPLYLGATKCRSTKVRHQVTSLLRGTELQKKLWNKLGVYSIAEKLSSIEEHAVVAAGAIPASLDPKWVDITCFLEESRILLRYCRQDEFGGLIWTQEWIGF